VAHTSDTALTLIIGLGVAGLLLVLITRKTQDLVNAAMLFSLVWTLNLLACEVVAYDALHLHFTTLVVVIGAWWAFLVGFLVSCWFRWPVLRGAGVLRPRRGKVLLVALIVLQLVAIGIEVKQSGLLGGGGDMFGQIARMADLRNSSGGFPDVKIPTIWNVWRWDFTLYLPLAFLLSRSGALRRRWLVLIAVFAVVTAVLRFTRAPLLNVITICVVGVGILRGPAQERWRHAWGRLIGVVVAFAAFVIVFGLMQAALTRDNPGVGTGTGEGLLPYVGGPFRAYEDVLRNGDWWKSGRVYSLDFVDFLAFKLGLRSDYEGTIRPFVEIGVTTNCYTYLDAFTIDAGVPGAVLGSLLLGVGVGGLLSLVRRSGGYFSVVMYSYSAYNCLMAGANNQFVQFGFFLTAFLAVLFGSALAARPLGWVRFVKQVPQQSN
jgi:oligosaccharide repeat unit polymerase